MKQDIIFFKYFWVFRSYSQPVPTPPKTGFFLEIIVQNTFQPILSEKKFFVVKIFCTQKIFSENIFRNIGSILIQDKQTLHPSLLDWKIFQVFSAVKYIYFFVFKHFLGQFQRKFFFDVKKRLSQFINFFKQFCKKKFILIVFWQGIQKYKHFLSESAFVN